jgi:hypothetical protein
MSWVIQLYFISFSAERKGLLFHADSGPEKYVFQHSVIAAAVAVPCIRAGGGAAEGGRGFDNRLAGGAPQIDHQIPHELVAARVLYKANDAAEPCLSFRTWASAEARVSASCSSFDEDTLLTQIGEVRREPSPNEGQEKSR